MVKKPLEKNVKANSNVAFINVRREQPLMILRNTGHF